MQNLSGYRFRSNLIRHSQIYSTTSNDIIVDLRIDAEFDVKMRTTISLPDNLVREIDLSIEAGDIIKSQSAYC